MFGFYRNCLKNDCLTSLRDFGCFIFFLSSQSVPQKTDKQEFKPGHQYKVYQILFKKHSCKGYVFCQWFQDIVVQS